MSMPIIHVVLFKLKASLDAASTNKVGYYSLNFGRHHTTACPTRLGEANSNLVQICDDMVSLKDQCVSPTTGKPYIVRSSGGVDNSPEGAQVGSSRYFSVVTLTSVKHGMTHGFVVEFASKEDRDYYVFQDPAHNDFKDSIAGKYDDVTVVDYDVGVF